MHLPHTGDNHQQSQGVEEVGVGVEEVGEEEEEVVVVVVVVEKEEEEEEEEGRRALQDRGQSFLPGHSSETCRLK